MSRRWLLAAVLGLLALAAAAAVQARAQARHLQAELETTRSLLLAAGGLQAGDLAERLALVDRAEQHASAAGGLLGRWPLRELAAAPLLGRDVRVARAVTAAASDTVRATRGVVAAVAPVQSRPLSRARIARAAAALLVLHRTLDADRGRVAAARPLLLARSARARYLDQAAAASRSALGAGQGLRLAGRLWGPAGSARYFLALQNPAELRGTGGLIGEYGILESSPQGPRLVTVAPYGELDRRTHGAVALPAALDGARYRRLGVDRAWSAVNIPPDLPAVGAVVTRLYQLATGDRLDGMVAVDPLALAEILRVGGPVEVDGVRLDAGNVAAETMVQAYVRYQQDNDARRRFLQQVTRATFAVFQRALAARPAELVRQLAHAANGRHLQVYASDPGGERALDALGLAGSAAPPPAGDYLMAVGVNAAGNKLDAFLHRTIGWRVRLGPDGGARTTATVTLRNDAPAAGLPRYIIGPYDRRFRAGDNHLIQSLYVAAAYGFTAATVDGHRVAAQAQADLGGLALTEPLVVPSRRTVTLRYTLVRHAAVAVLDRDHLQYRLLLRPQATARPDQARVVVSAPPGWRFAAGPPGARVSVPVASWSGPIDRERTLAFELVRG